MLEDKNPEGSKTIKAENAIKNDTPYLDKNSITISLVSKVSIYRQVNMAALPDRRDFIGSSINSRRKLSANREELNKYFPNLLGISHNDPMFITRVTNWLNNISFPVTGVGKKLDVSFNYDKYSDYIEFEKAKTTITTKYKNASKNNLAEKRRALDVYISELNELESSRYKYGVPFNVEEYLIYRHCLLYRDVAKDPDLIHSDPSVRFYFNDEQKDNDRIKKLQNSSLAAKRNFIKVIDNDNLFDAIYTQYCVYKGLSLTIALTKDITAKQRELDAWSNEEPAKFNEFVDDKSIEVKSIIEKLIAKSELVRSTFNQNISTVDGTFIGANMKEAVAFFNNPANESIVNAYKTKLSL